MCPLFSPMVENYRKDLRQYSWRLFLLQLLPIDEHDIAQELNRHPFVRYRFVVVQKVKVQRPFTFFFIKPVQQVGVIPPDNIIHIGISVNSSTLEVDLILIYRRQVVTGKIRTDLW